MGKIGQFVKIDPLGKFDFNQKDQLGQISQFGKIDKFGKVGNLTKSINSSMTECQFLELPKYYKPF